jgi:hypothetical protein
MPNNTLLYNLFSEVKYFILKYQLLNHYIVNLFINL